MIWLRLIWGFISGISLQTLLIAVCAIAFGWWTFHWYSAGVAHERAAWTALVAKERADQEKAVREAGEDAWRAIDKLITELENRNALIDQLNAEGDADPDAGSGGITADSVSRINRGRTP